VHKKVIRRHNKPAALPSVDSADDDDDDMTCQEFFQRLFPNLTDRYGAHTRLLEQLPSLAESDSEFKEIFGETTTARLKNLSALARSETKVSCSCVSVSHLALFIILRVGHRGV
jgi:hypothetical protein